MNTITKNNNSYTPNFCGQRLFNVNLIRKITPNLSINIPAHFTKLDTFDTPLAYEICDNWSNTKFGEMICKHYLKKESGYRHSINNEFFIIESKYGQSPEQKVKAIAETKINNKIIELMFLQSRTQLKEKDHVQGAGSMLLYGLCKYAKQIKAKRIELVPDSLKNEEWYKKLGFSVDPDELFFFLPRRNFNKFIKNIETIFSKKHYANTTK